jgi:hypothetical protein
MWIFGGIFKVEGIEEFVIAARTARSNINKSKGRRTRLSPVQQLALWIFPTIKIPTEKGLEKFLVLGRRTGPL